MQLKQPVRPSRSMLVLSCCASATCLAVLFGVKRAFCFVSYRMFRREGIRFARMPHGWSVELPTAPMRLDVLPSLARKTGVVSNEKAYYRNWIYCCWGGRHG